MILNEQEITNAICLHYGERVGVPPNAVDVQLMWDEEQGFSGQIWIGERTQIIVPANILEAVAQYLFKERGLRVFQDQIHLELEDEIYARIDV